MLFSCLSSNSAHIDMAAFWGFVLLLGQLLISVAFSCLSTTMPLCKLELQQQQQQSQPQRDYSFVGGSGSSTYDYAGSTEPLPTNAAIRKKQDSFTGK